MDLNEQLYGANRSDKDKRWEKEEAALNEKYAYWLTKRPDPIYPDDESKFDQIQNHYIMRWNATQTEIGFRKETELPSMIQDDILFNFRKVYEEK